MNVPREALDTLRSAVGNEHSSVYRDLYRSKAFDFGAVNYADSWQTVPTLTKSDMTRVDVRERTFIPWREVDAIRVSSGTTGRGFIPIARNPISIPLQKELPLQGKNIVCFHYYQNTITPLAEKDARFFCADRLALPESAVLAAQIGADALVGPVPVLLNFLDHIRGKMPLEQVRCVMSLTERCTRAQWTMLRSAYPNATIVIEYGLSETGPAAYSADSRSAETSIILKALPHLFIEIVDEQGKQVSLGESGEIVITTLTEIIAFPLIRYRTGDRGIFLGNDHPRLLFEITGRIGQEFIRIEGGEIQLEELERAVHKALGTERIEVVGIVEEIPHNGKLITRLTVELAPYDPSFSRSNPSHIADTISRILRVNERRTYADGVLHGIYAPLSCAFLEPDIFTRKRRHLVDRRP